MVTGTPAATAALASDVPDVNQLGQALFTDYVYAFEITAVLLTIAVVGAVVLVRRSEGKLIDSDEFPDGTAADELAAESAAAAVVGRGHRQPMTRLRMDQPANPTPRRSSRDVGPDSKSASHPPGTWCWLR